MTTDQRKWFEIKVPCLPEYVSMLRLTISGFGHRLGMSYDEIEDVKLALGEGVLSMINCCQAPLEVGTQVVIKGTGQGDLLKLELSHCHCPCNLTKGSCFPQESMSFFLMETLMDDVKIDYEKGLSVTLTKKIRGFNNEGNE